MTVIGRGGAEPRRWSQVQCAQVVPGHWWVGATASTGTGSAGGDNPAGGSGPSPPVTGLAEAV